MATNGVTLRLKQNRLPELARAFPGAVSATFRRGAFVTEGGMKVRSPVRTGFNRNSIHTQGAMPGSLSMRVVVGSSYGAFLELGTRRMPPRPYARPTTEQTFPHVIRELQQLERAL